MTSECSISGCGRPAAPGVRLCHEHLDRVDAACEAAAEGAQSEPDPADPYDLLVMEYMAKISRSGQMRGLAMALVEGGVRTARESFPDLKQLPSQLADEISSFLAVSVVSAVIQERAHLLARAKMLAEVLPAEQAAGIERAIEEEMRSLDEGDESV